MRTTVRTKDEFKSGSTLVVAYGQLPFLFLFFFKVISAKNLMSEFYYTENSELSLFFERYVIHFCGVSSGCCN